MKFSYSIDLVFHEDTQEQVVLKLLKKDKNQQKPNLMNILFGF